ncbi:MAG TPA: ABC transporter permease [Acetobacteraceae bacterium]|nr:ABC transporter permease [Acetobacteraceae bacterium]
MSTYILRRLLLTVPVVIGILFTTFLIKAAIPSDAVVTMYQGQLSEQDASKAIAIMRHKYGLDRPWYMQFLSYTEGVLTGNLGQSIRTRQPVIKEIGYRYRNTLELTFAAFLVALTVGVVSGVVAAYFKDTWLDITSMTVSLFGISMPAFFFGLVLIMVVSVWLRWLPVIENGWQGLILPALTLGLIEAAPLARVARSSMVEALGRDYIRAARAKGMPESVVVLRHALPNALLSIVTLAGLQIGSLFGGAFIIEVIFSWHGIGELAVEAIQWRDFTITQGVILISATTYVLINLVVDILYTWIDPRIVVDKS